MRCAVCRLVGAVELRTAGGTSAGFAHDGACLCLLWESHFLRATSGTDDEQAECLGRWQARRREVRGERALPTPTSEAEDAVAREIARLGLGDIANELS